MHTTNDSQKVFVDTCSFVSLHDDRDSNHEKAIALAKILFEQKVQLYTSSDVIGETLTVIARKLGKKAAGDFYKEYGKSSIIELFVNHDIHEKTRDFFLHVTSKNISFIDCSNVIVMKQNSIQTIFTFDQDFKKFDVSLF